MKITPKQYALTLFELVKEQKEEKIREIIKRFVVLLVKNNDLTKFKKIIEQFSKIYNRAEGIVEVEIISYQELGDNIIKLLRSYIKDLTKAGEVIFKPRVDKNILGGVVLKYEDKMLDGSMRSRLNDLRSLLEK